ncbi:unnamed protein product, partial [Iphiclides podalirius]
MPQSSTSTTHMHVTKLACQIEKTLPHTRAISGGASLKRSGLYYGRPTKVRTFIFSVRIGLSGGAVVSFDGSPSFARSAPRTFDGRDSMYRIAM